MGTAALPHLNPIADTLDRGARKPAAETLLRRAKQRRQMQGMTGVSYLIDALLLLTYAHAGSVSTVIGPAYAICGLSTVAFNIALSESGYTERFRDHYFVTQQVVVSMTILLIFTYIAPEVGVMFICSLFIVFNFSALRSTTLQMAAIWTAVTFGLAALFLLTDKPISIPHETYLERFTTMLVFALSIGRCMFLGIFASSMRESLYKSGLALKEAYKRIEELAELDELTGSLNRRSVMRTLNEEISRAHRTGSPCSLALIDLDWFKRINDTYGHLTGDEVLRTFAITVFANIRAVDRFGRFGGEEFLLVLPDTAEETAARTLDRLRLIVTALDWSAFSPGMRVTISGGIATLTANETSDTFLARADSALYKAKAQGRNCIVSA